MGDEIWGLRILNSLGWLHTECGDLERALDLNRRAAEGARKRGDPETIANSELNLGDIFLAQGDFGAAEGFFDRVHHQVRDPATSEWMRWRYSTRLFASLGEMWLARGDPVKAREFNEQSLEIAKRTSSQKYLVRGWRLKGEIALAHRQLKVAEEWLLKSLDLAQAIGNPTQLWKTHLTMGRVHTEAKRLEKARPEYRAARSVVERIKTNLQDPKLRASLENYPVIRQIFELSGDD